MSNNPFLMSPDDRMTHWKTFRRSLTDLETSKQLELVAQYWSKAPIGPLAYNPENAKQWLTPWEMIHHNQWCRSSVALGMEQTLRLAGMDKDRLTLRLVSDKTNGALLLLIVDGLYVLNYDWGSVFSLPLTGHRVMREWRFAEREYLEIE